MSFLIKRGQLVFEPPSLDSMRLCAQSEEASLCRSLLLLQNPKAASVRWNGRKVEKLRLKAGVFVFKLATGAILICMWKVLRAAAVFWWDDLLFCYCQLMRLFTTKVLPRIPLYRKTRERLEPNKEIRVLHIDYMTDGEHGISRSL